MKLICPVCKAQLVKYEKEAVCANGHHYDYAKSGYLNLLRKQSRSHGDDAGMVKARTNFLASGAYGFLREALCDITKQYTPSVLADLGCGEGYYTSLLEAEEKYGFDMSKDALKHAAKNDHSTQYAVASIFALPLPDACCEMVLTCFAPFAGDEISRILKDGGKFVFVTPGKRHLFELKELLYETPYENRITDLDTSLKLIDTQVIQNTFHASNEALMDLFMMTPYAYRTAEAGKEKLRRTESLDVTAEFIIRIYEK